jgi:hypothetical protein
MESLKKKGQILGPFFPYADGLKRYFSSLTQPLSLL